MYVFVVRIAQWQLFFIYVSMPDEMKRAHLIWYMDYRLYAKGHRLPARLKVETISA